MVYDFTCDVLPRISHGAAGAEGGLSCSSEEELAGIWGQLKKSVRSTPALRPRELGSCVRPAGVQTPALGPCTRASRSGGRGGSSE
ncbi:hypothetical protein GN956_G11929 [Arapaima gigas]